MSDLDRRLARAERQVIYQNMVAAAAQYGLHPTEVIEEAQRFFALSEAEQDAEIQRDIEDAQAEGNQEEVEIFIHFHDSIQSYR
jgi:hypothetical protein